MALFKISKGQSSVLDQQALNEGYAWFTPDNGKFYIDAYVRKEVDGVEKDVLTRIPLCADTAERDGEGRNIVDTYSNFYITAVKQNDTISADKTHDEIIQAYNNGSNIILAYRDDDAGEKVKFLPLYSWLNDGNDFSFTCAYNNLFSEDMIWAPSNMTSGSFNSVYYVNGLWVAGGSGYGLWYSSDGKTWTRSNITSGTFNSIYYSNGLWVTGDGSNTGLYYSTDGKTWTQSNITSGNCLSVYYANGLWVAGGNRGLYYSTDGKAWTRSNVASGSFRIVCYGNNIWVAGSSNTGLYYSTDGKTWTQSNITSGNCLSVYCSNDIWIAGTNDDVGLYYSTDGKTWTQSNITSGWFKAIYYANGLWVAGGNRGLYYSTDGKAWTQSNVTSGIFQSVYYDDGIWVAEDNSIYYSTNGKTWTQSFQMGSGYFYSIYYSNSLWVTGGGNGLFYAFSPFSLSTEVLTITYNSTSGWKKLIDQMVTSVDGETGKVTTNAVKFIEQNLTTSEKTQAKTNIEAAGVASDLITTKPSVNVVPKFDGSTDYPTLTKTNVYIKDDKLGVGVANPQSALDVAGVATVGGLTITDEPGTQSNAPTDNSHLTNKKYVDEQDENLRNKLVQGTEDNYKLPYIEKENGSGTGITSLENAAISDSLVVKGAAEDDGLGIQGPSTSEDYYKILTNNDKNLYVDATKIGIGTATPITKVHVVGETTVDGAININDGNVTITGGQVIQSNAPTDNSHLTNKKYVDDSFRANDAMLFKGVINSASDLPVEHYTGWTYKVGTKGSYLGQWCEVGDTIYCVSDSAASATAQVNADWQILENNNENVVVRGNGASVGSVGSATQPVYVDANGVVQTTKDFNDYLPLNGGTMSGDLQVGSGAVIQTDGSIVSTKLRTTADVHLSDAAGKVAVIDSNGWIFYRTVAEIVSDLGLKLTVADDGNGNVSLSMGGK